MTFNASIFALGSTIIFAGQENGVRGLWGSDGTAAGTQVLNAEIDRLGNLFARTEQVGDTLFFSAQDATIGQEFWQTDGTSTGTRLIADLNPGAASSNASIIGRLPGGLILSATDGTTGAEPWFLPLPATLSNTNGQSGAPGSTFALSGSGFPAGAPVTITVTPPAPATNRLANTPDPVVVGEVTANANGEVNFGVQFAVGASAGVYTITASNGTVSQSTSVTISPSAPVLTAPAELPTLQAPGLGQIFLPLLSR